MKLSHLDRLLEENESLPTRGAWIEIIKRGDKMDELEVAPHAGSVD